MQTSNNSQQLRPPQGVIEIIRDLEGAGFEAWCVGGAVRDALMGHAHLDWDIATSATPDQVRTLFGRRRTIPVGIEFGTVGVLDASQVMHEVTTFRRDVRTDGRHAEVEFGASLDEDLARRDFTINAIAFSPSRQQIHDPFDGRGDIAAGVIRAVGAPGDRMREDRLRALRGIRFASRFGFAIEPATWEAICQSAPYLTRLSAERVKQELEKTMDQVARPSGAIARWRESGALAVLVPELEGLSAEARHALDCAAQPALARRPGRRLTRFAILFSDSSSASALQAAMRLRFSKHDAQWIAALVERWNTLRLELTAALSAGAPEPARVRGWIAAVGRTHLSAFFRLASARWAASQTAPGGGGGGGALNDGPAAHAVQRLYRRCVSAALSEPVDLRDLAIDGDDLRQVGIAPGPGLGKILTVLLARVLEDPARNSREWLLGEAQRLKTPAD
ncbi:MAG: CCA tRNA nucleotidyltransferase [Gemmatimonadaceae bacterium]